MPNTALYRQVKQEGRLLADGLALWKHLDKATNTIRYDELAAEEMEQAFEDVVTHFFRPQAIAKTFLEHVIGKGQLVMPSIYLGAALRKGRSRCRSVAFTTGDGHHLGETGEQPVAIKLLS